MSSIMSNEEVKGRETSNIIATSRIRTRSLERVIITTVTHVISNILMNFTPTRDAIIVKPLSIK